MKKANSKKNYLSDYTFRKWVRMMNDQFNRNDSSSVFTKDEYTYVLLRSKVGISKCNPNDTWDSEIGIAYAWARCTEQLEYYVKNYVPNPGDWVSIEYKGGGCTSVLQFVTEGADEYCFKMGSGNLVLINKSEVADIIKE